MKKKNRRIKIHNLQRHGLHKMGNKGPKVMSVAPIRP